MHYIVRKIGLFFLWFGNRLWSWGAKPLYANHDDVFGLPDDEPFFTPMKPVHVDGYYRKKDGS